MAALSILLLSEDGGESSAIQEQIVTKMLRLLDPECRLDGSHVEILPSNDKAAQQMKGSNWKSRHGAVDLVRVIARKLSEPSGFVVVHIDADVTWPGRSPNVDKFKARILQIRQILQDAKTPAAVIEARARRLCLLVPYFELEAWLYQSTDTAIGLCHKHHHGRDAEKFAAWRDDRAALDTLRDAKDQTCLRDAHNLTLAKSFPAKDAFEAGASFARAVGCLKRTEGLLAALARTHAPAWSSPEEPPPPSD